MVTLSRAIQSTGSQTTRAMYPLIGFVLWLQKSLYRKEKKRETMENVGRLVRWRHSDEAIIGVVIRDLGVTTATRKYLIWWPNDGMIKNYEFDLEFLC